jgi:hypothetical protein
MDKKLESSPKKTLLQSPGEKLELISSVNLLVLSSLTLLLELTLKEVLKKS